MLQPSIDAVQEFHIAKNIDFKDRLKPLRNQPGNGGNRGGVYAFNSVANAVSSMKNASSVMLRAFKHAMRHHEHQYDTHDMCVHGTPDYRFLRVSLILEEVAELIEGLMEGDEIQTLDGMADSIYVINGTAVTYDLPLNAAFVEVHNSNMSKTATGPRLEDKGSSYRPPDLSLILEEHRNARIQQR